MDPADQHANKDKQLESQILEHQQHSAVTSSELADLWSNYMGDSMYVVIFEHFIEIVEDEEVKELLLFSQGLSKRHITTISELFTKEGIPVPAGFGESDLHKAAPRLFDDTFILFFLQQMAVGGYGQYARALTSSTRQDIIDYYRQGIHELNELYERSTHLLSEKGTILKPPKIPYPKQVEFVENNSFTSFFSSKNRPLASIEIKYMNLNMTMNILGKSLTMGFSQVASSKKLRKYFQEGRELSDKIIRQMGSMLANDNIPSPMTMDPHVTDSKVPPFSDKLMLYQGGLANQLGLENIGISMSRTLRHDIHAKYAKFMAEIGVYSNHGQQMMIDRGWLEQPPLAADRDKLVHNPLQ
ncbi:DUF3231 family protein [Halobacillus naozhouensis]|uniref:DUF3231 family protein n=1 Tax=Halobacillus naozhouensis TaxID=554880 RepID=A0ABY8J112_9BACI|nr:DUF3231 family protein [Halobacillus naozhouensis]WFT76188.1 DUF3231 family protein [Halobacillus naozhouensis]